MTRLWRLSVPILLAAAAVGVAVSAAEPAAAPEAKPAETKPAAATPAPKLTYSPEGADTCLGCHDDEIVLAIFKGKHGVPGKNQTPFGHGQLQCEACHGPGGLHIRKPESGKERVPLVRFDADSPTPVAVQNGKCASCHQKDLGAGWHASTHATNEVACASCHTSHAARDPVLAVSTQPEKCATCHQIERMDAHRAFAHPIDAGKMSCTGCHSVHGTNHESLLAQRTTNDTCFACHADKRGPFLWEHAPVAEDCTSCHAPHGSIHSGMLKVRGPMLCKSCHSETAHPSLAPVAGASLGSGQRAPYTLGQNCLNCHSQVHGSNHPSGSKLMR
jgi:DmsE family decaheme c-type cytochrome